MLSKNIDGDILACLPKLRTFARSLTGDRDRADDLVQDAVLRALSAARQFTSGTDFKAWTFTILRNLYFSESRRNRPFVRPLEAADLGTYVTAPAQQAGLEFDDFRAAFDMLPAEQRDALVLVGADGYRYGEAAKICGCPTGTLKSRVARARHGLKEMLGLGTCGLAQRTKRARAFIHGASPRQVSRQSGKGEAMHANREVIEFLCKDTLFAAPSGRRYRTHTNVIGAGDVE